MIQLQGISYLGYGYHISVIFLFIIDWIDTDFTQNITSNTVAFCECPTFSTTNTRNCAIVKHITINSAISIKNPAFPCFLGVKRLSDFSGYSLRLMVC